MEIIKKWCSILPFSEKWKEEIIRQSEFFDVSLVPATPMENLLKVLYDCEELSLRYKKCGIEEKILMDTLGDIVVWTQNHYMVNGEIGLSEMDWINHHMNMMIFCLGRLQFCAGKMKEDCKRLGIKKGDSIVEVHIPQGKPLVNDECKNSFKQAIKFFEKYFPEYEYQYFTCESWLLDCNLKNFLDEQSNIIKFQSNFEVISYEESNQAYERLFTLNNQKDKESSLQKKVRAHIKNGGKLYEGYGIINKKIL